MKKKLGITLLVLTAFVILGYLPSGGQLIPVENATEENWSMSSYWFYPWGISGVHKGIDIFANRGTAVLAPVSGMVLDCGYKSVSGNYIYLLGPKWRIHYFAHLDTILIKKFTFYTKGDKIGSVGNTGNAASKPPHLHYSVSRIIPNLFAYSRKSPQGWKKIFYINPEKLFDAGLFAPE